MNYEAAVEVMENGGYVVHPMLRQMNRFNAIGMDEDKTFFALRNPVKTGDKESERIPYTMTDQDKSVTDWEEIEVRAKPPRNAEEAEEQREAVEKKSTPSRRKKK